MIKRIAELTSADVVLVGSVSRLGREIQLNGNLYDATRGGDTEADQRASGR